MLKQVLEASRMATDNSKTQAKILIEAINILLDYKKYDCSPEIALAMHQTVKKYSKNLDPYNRIKIRDIKTAKEVYPFLKSFLQEKSNGLYWALKVSATGNNIDSAIYNNVDIKSCIANELEKNFGICDIDSFENKLERSGSILIIGDNAGETVFDKVLAEYLLGFGVKIIYAVRNNPIINDTTFEEALESGLDSCTSIISTGCDAPGAIIKKCSNEFIEIFNSSDLVISKGQGNYEALSDCGRNVFFLLKAKCPVISKRLNVNVNEYVFKEI
jgi:uncharacterized protein with ATP-grasp and redox domains